MQMFDARYTSPDEPTGWRAYCGGKHETHACADGLQNRPVRFIMRRLLGVWTLFHGVYDLWVLDSLARSETWVMPTHDAVVNKRKCER